MLSPKLYAYFDIATGNLLAFSNEVRTEYEYKLEVTKEQYHRFVTGIERFSDWVVCRTKNVDYEFEIVQKHQQNVLFKNNLFEKITNNADDNTELTVHCDISNKSWVVIITDEFRQRIYDDPQSTIMRNKNVELYITVANEPNLLLQKITTTIQQLIHDKQIFPFVSGYETNLATVNILTMNPFFSYGIQKGSNE